MKHRKLHLNIRKNITSSVTAHWNRLPRKVVDTESLVLLKVRLDGALDSLIQLLASVTMAEGLELDDL